MAEWGIASFQKVCERVANLNAKSDSAIACAACQTKSDFAIAVEAEREKVRRELGVPVCDVIRHGPDDLVNAILALQRQLFPHLAKAG